MRRSQASPLPRRNGLEPACVRLPNEPWIRLRDYLVGEFPRESPARIDQMLRNGEIVTIDGPVGFDAPYVSGSRIWFHRDLPVEAEVPFEIGIVHRDETILVIDKPHFLATIPRGKHIMQTALVRLRTELDLPDLTPAHRLDRGTAGLVLMVIDPAFRGAYQMLFQRRIVEKRYDAIAPYDCTLKFPRTVETRIEKDRGTISVRQSRDDPNSETFIDIVEQSANLARYTLRPVTGRTHQLRAHMNYLGVPICGDDIYPILTDRPLDDYRQPLQLLANRLSFIDPVSGDHRHFTTQHALLPLAEVASWEANY